MEANNSRKYRYLTAGIADSIVRTAVASGP